jgi:hypothetical protein
MINVARENLIYFGTLAERLHVSQQAIHTWRRRGLEAIKLGGKWYTSERALNAYAEINTPGGPAPESFEPVAVGNPKSPRLLKEMFGI